MIRYSESSCDSKEKSEPDWHLESAIDLNK